MAKWTRRKLKGAKHTAEEFGEAGLFFVILPAGVLFMAPWVSVGMGSGFLFYQGCKVYRKLASNKHFHS